MFGRRLGDEPRRIPVLSLFCLVYGGYGNYGAGCAHVRKTFLAVDSLK